MVWGLKMDPTSKERWVLDVQKNPYLIGSTYACVVSRDSAQIAFIYAALNGINVWSAGIRNYYLQDPSSQKDYIICRLEFGLKNVGKVALINRALYSRKSAERNYLNDLWSCMRHL